MTLKYTMYVHGKDTPANDKKLHLGSRTSNYSRVHRSHELRSRTKKSFHTPSFSVQIARTSGRVCIRFSASG